MSNISVSIMECPICGNTMRKVFFTEYEYDKNNIRTGRKRLACNHLECDQCGNKEIVDDSFDGPWHY